MNIEDGIHDDEECDKYCESFNRIYKVLPDCQFKRNKSKIQGLIKKVHIDADGTATEVLFDIKNDNTVSEPECDVTWNDCPKGLKESTNTKICSYSPDSIVSNPKSCDSKPKSCDFNNDAIFKCEGLSIFTCKNNQTVGAVELKKYISKHKEKILKGCKKDAYHLWRTWGSNWKSGSQ